MTEDDSKADCSGITNDILLSLAEGRLEEGLRARVRAHLDGCESCRIRAEEVGLIGEALAGDAQLSENIPIPERVDRAVFATISEVAGKQRRVRAMARTLRWLVPAAAVVTVVVIAGFLLTGRRESLESSARHAEKQPPAMVTQREYARIPDLPLDRRLPVQPPSVEPVADASASLKEQLKREKEEKEQYSRQLAQEKEKAESLEEALKKRDEDIRKLRETMAGLREALEKQDEKFRNLEDENVRLSRILENFKKDTTDLREEVRRLKSESGDSKAVIVRLQEEKAGLEKRLLIVGDLNSDRKADVSDAMLIVGSLLSDGRISFSPEGDANGDGEVDVGDALSILNKALTE